MEQIPDAIHRIKISNIKAWEGNRHLSKVHVNVLAESMMTHIDESNPPLVSVPDEHFEKLMSNDGGDIEVICQNGQHRLAALLQIGKRMATVKVFKKSRLTKLILAKLRSNLDIAKAMPDNVCVTLSRIEEYGTTFFNMNQIC